MTDSADGSSFSGVPFATTGVTSVLLLSVIVGAGLSSFGVGSGCCCVCCVGSCFVVVVCVFVALLWDSLLLWPLNGV